jgi:Tfp pilus assembly protein PilF
LFEGVANDPTIGGTRVKKTSILLVACLIAAVAAPAALAQAWRGVGRLHGTVIDKDGKPVKGAKVILKSVRGSDTGPEPIVTDAKGRWQAGGLIGGQWNIDVEAEGFLVRKMTANVSEVERLSPPMKIELEAAPPPPPPQAEQAPVQETIQVGGVEVSPEIAAALEAANNFMKAEKWKEAALEYEKAIAVLTDNQQLKFALARAYYGAGELKKAIGLLQQVYDADTGNVTAATLLANMLIEDGQLDAGKKVLSAMPEGAVTDPNVFLNVGILFVNKNKPDDAYTYFDRAVQIAPEVPASYYYRALASLQLKKMDAARADLRKVIELAPESTEAKDAKELLAQMK